MVAFRVALLGGSEMIRAAKRAVLENEPNFQIVYDSDGFGLLPQDLQEVNFDLAIVEQRLGSQSAFDFIRVFHSLAVMEAESQGQFLVASQFHETHLRIMAIESGALDCVFISDGPQSLIDKVSRSINPETDFAIRELIPELGKPTISQSGFQNTSVALDSLEKKETRVLQAFCQLKSDEEIATAVGASIVKVRSTLKKIQKLLLLDTRSQLLLRMYRLGALAL